MIIHQNINHNFCCGIMWWPKYIPQLMFSLWGRMVFHTTKWIFTACIMPNKLPAFKIHADLQIIRPNHKTQIKVLRNLPCGWSSESPSRSIGMDNTTRYSCIKIYRIKGNDKLTKVSHFKKINRRNTLKTLERNISLQQWPFVLWHTFYESNEPL